MQTTKSGILTARDGLKKLHVHCQQNCSSSVVVVLEQDKLFTDGLCGQLQGLRNPSCWDKLHCAARGRATSEGSCTAPLAQCPACGAVVRLARCLVASFLSPGFGGEVGCRWEFNLGFPPACCKENRVWDGDSRQVAVHRRGAWPLWGGQLSPSPPRLPYSSAW